MNNMRYTGGFVNKASLLEINRIRVARPQSVADDEIHTRRQ